MSKLKLAQQSFLIQYLSLILIVLSILIAALRAHKPATKEIDAKYPAEIMASYHPNFLKSEVRLENVFTTDETSINSESFNSIWQLLANHNINLQLQIVSPNNVASKVLRLSRILRENGFWKDSFTVRGSLDPSLSSTIVTARFEWSKP